MKIILFDIDETLLSCRGEANAKGSRKMFNEVFQIDTDEEVINHVGKTEKAIIEEVIRFKKQLSPDQEVEIPNRAYQAWAEGVADVLKEYQPIILPGIENLLKGLSNDPNVLMCILTGNSRERAIIKLKAAGLERFFTDDRGVLRGAFGDISNQRGDLIKEAKDKYGEGIYIVVDDSIVAGKMIVENNIPGILVATGSASVEELQQYSEFVFKDFGENRWQEAINIINTIQE